jgi:hypothetical protein
MWKPISFSELLCFNNSNVLELPGRSVWSQPLLTSILLVCLLQLYATPPSPVSREHSQKQTSNTAWTSPPSQALLTGRWIDLTTWHSRCSPMPYAITCKLLFPFHRKEYISGAMVCILFGAPPPKALCVQIYSPLSRWKFNPTVVSRGGWALISIGGGHQGGLSWLNPGSFVSREKDQKRQHTGALDLAM